MDLQPDSLQLAPVRAVEIRIASFGVGISRINLTIYTRKTGMALGDNPASVPLSPQNPNETRTGIASGLSIPVSA